MRILLCVWVVFPIVLAAQTGGTCANPFEAAALPDREIAMTLRSGEVDIIGRDAPGLRVSCVVDDLGYVQQNREEMEVLFTFFAERYERGSVLLTSNLPFSKWEQIFRDPMTTAAAIDRLVHHSVIMELNLPSYRAEQAKKGKEKRNGEAPKEAGKEDGQ